ncbi:AraC family transcriptional regulator [Herbaspirillum seropedicae]|uniref:AraC family transcription regulator protein n=1 Tax=Herbaspirillum seropedicae (strain SmR1) TaxID=757424 RepID=D8ITP9_HERSS|nr:AraC family transcriptional regulator [Herbaspirillum seropedicae]ADJ61540.1 AraC family transcription regulator protein [Herbaspirillum seropedicae SmR1]AKN63763.1 hypothetical protein ACP92_00045 [Herbaspirillum seropedicae]UMU19671.1 AraC family transcriptional regulator [Herbaspirillum seropedicae]
MPSAPRVPPASDRQSCILSAAATGLLEFIQSEGGDPERILGAAGADCNAIEQPTARLSLDIYCNAMEQAARQTQNEHFGLRFGQQFMPAGLGMLGYLGLTSPTVGEALRNMGAMFHHHQQRSHLGLTQADGLAYVEYRITDPLITQRRQDAELSIGMFFNVLRQALGQQWSPLEIRFEHGALHGKEEHEHIFGAPIQFSQGTNAIVLRGSDLNAPMPGADAHLHSLMRNNLRQLGLIAATEETLVDKVRAVIRLRLDDSEPTLDEIASALGMANWTLQRRLRTAGLTYQELLLEVRKDMALEYLKDPDLQISELAFLLGYSEISAFSRAFQRWHGMSPTEWRRQHLVGRPRVQ